ncbi:MAG TPA: hypothetical protein ACFYD2_11885 [Candidatus Avalokitesvara rifleensis]|uniref:hypothetical protein n=1 Tax=Candidatus Avalokitesvara rifleensis TaxID=3367620 RepID=UPI0027127A0E|nr:hypothetical protein [Candidatus Brocadiales bacterium]
MDASQAISRIRGLRAFLTDERKTTPFFLRLAVYLSVFSFIILYLPPGVNYFLTCSTARVTAVILCAFGVNADATGPLVWNRDFRMEVILQCIGIYETAILSSCILAHHTTVKKKAIGLVLGFATVYSFTILRLVLLFLAGVFYPSYFGFTHYYLFNATALIIILYVWMFWLDKVVKGEKVENGLVFLGKFLLCTIAVSIIWAKISWAYYLLLRITLNGLFSLMGYEAVLQGKDGFLTFYCANLILPLNVGPVAFSVVTVLSLMCTLPNIELQRKIVLTAGFVLFLYALHTVCLFSSCLGFYLNMGLLVTFSIFLGCVVNVLLPFIIAIGFLYLKGLGIREPAPL